MKILLVCATSAEAVLIPPMPVSITKSGFFPISHPKHKIKVLITGVGMMSTAYQLGRTLLIEKFDLAINTGICGSFIQSTPLGTVVNITQDVFADLGVEDGDKFLDLFQTGLMTENETPFKKGVLYAQNNLNENQIDGLKQAKGITVNKVHGNEESIYKIIQQYQPDVESMEGAAFIYCCLMNGIPCIQLRAVSNYVEKRNRSNWKINEALSNLKIELERLLQLI